MLNIQVISPESDKLYFINRTINKNAIKLNIYCKLKLLIIVIIKLNLVFYIDYKIKDL